MGLGLQDFYLDFPEVDGVAFGLERNRAALDKHVAAVRVNQLFRVGVSGVVLRLVVLQHRLSADAVDNRFAAARFNLHGDPLVAVVGLGGGVEAVGRVEFSVFLDVRAGGAQVGGGAFA